MIPRFYPIIDLGSFAGTADPIAGCVEFCEQIVHAGATLVQFRDKSGDIPRMLSCARELRRITQGRATLLINDRLDICLACDADGVHLGQDDLSPAAARKIFEGARRPSTGAARLIGFSTHNLSQLGQADATPIDYVAIGPVFATSSKANPDPAVGLDGVRQARVATSKPLVAIGGITRKNCRQVLDAGAASVAVISDLLESPVKAVEEFIRVLG